MILFTEISLVQELLLSFEKDQQELLRSCRRKDGLMNLQQ